MEQPRIQAGSDSETAAVSTGMRLAPQRQSVIFWMCVILAAIIVFTFWPVLHCGFINYDDGDYVYENPHVATGLTPANVWWAFSTQYSSNWHPLTWISHMLDVQIFGLNPFGHHAVSLLLHVINTIVLFLVLVRMTSAPWRSFVVGALFALHPLHVESVAWISERKDVLSTFFFLLSIGAYVRFAQAASGQQSTIQSSKTKVQGLKFFYWLSFALFALGLMSKPMVVTLPFVLLLLDYWPLNRIHARENSRCKHVSLLVTEKLPFLFLAFASCLITVLAQRAGHAVKSFLPITLRGANAIVSYCTYLGKTLWPTRLAVFYPHPNTRYGVPLKDAIHPSSEQWPLWAIAIGAVSLVAISVLILKGWRRFPWLVTGWFWYLGTLVPVIGLVQVGMQSMADRYTYIPLIGVFIGVVWTVDVIVSQFRPTSRQVLSSVSAAVLLLCALVARRQAAYWHDTLSLFSHALRVTSNNATAEWQVGSERAKRGETGPAEAHFRAALLDDPYCVQAYSSLGELLELRGQALAAIKEYQRALDISPWDHFARNRLAGVLRKLGRTNESIAEYQKVLQFNPDNVEACYQLGAFYLDEGELGRARAFLNRTLQLKPDHTYALLSLWDLKSRTGDLPGAESALRKLVAIHPTNSDLRVNLGGVLWQQQKAVEATAEYQEAIRLEPESAVAHYNLGVAYAAQHKFAEARTQFEEAVRLNPKYPEALSELAWLLATDPQPQRRDYAGALAFAREALGSGGQTNLRAWTAFETIYAETGRFTEAIDAADKAIAIAKSAGETNLVASIENRRLGYQKRLTSKSP